MTTDKTQTGKPRSKSWKLRLGGMLLKLITVCMIVASCTLGSQDLLQLARSELETLKRKAIDSFTVVKLAEATNSKPVSQIIKDASVLYKIPPLVILAMVHQESGEELRPDRVRYEPRLQKRFKCSQFETEIECKFRASSFGLMQIIYGFHKQFCGLESYSDLLDPQKNIYCGTKLLRSCLDKRSGSVSQKFRACLSEYNGDDSGEYANQVLSRLALLEVEKQFS